mgnify:FL=1
MLYNNAQYKNETMDQGSVIEYYKKLKDIISTNDGTRSFIIRTEDCHDQNAPFNQSQETRLRITHNDHMISQITEGFINFKIKLTLQLSKDIQATHVNDTEKLGKIFVGFKSSNQLLDQLQIYSNNISSGYQQNECCREGFCYSTIKPYSEKKTRKYTHSLYENVSDYSQSVCGTYVDLNTLMDGQKHDVEFEMNLPFEDMLAFQAFDLYPNRIVGDIEIRFYVKPVGLVYCQVDPRKIKEVKEFMEDESIAATFTETPVFLHQFTQIGNESKIAALKIDSGNVTTTTKAVTLSCHGLTVTSCKSNMFGFGVKESTLQAIASMFSEPVSIPSQQLDYNAFPLAPTRAGVQSTINAPLNNTTSISVMFPKHSNDYTCFDNPIYHNVQLTINGQNYPDEPVSTLGARFLQYQLVASELDGGIQCTKEFEDSLTMPKNKDDGTRYKNTLSDASSFMLNIQTERSRGGYLFDGLDSNGQNVPIQIRGQPIHSGDGDTYFNCDETGKNHPPPPQVFFCRDTYFTVDIHDGLVYHLKGCPPGSQV